MSALAQMLQMVSSRHKGGSRNEFHEDYVDQMSQRVAAVEVIAQPRTMLAGTGFIVRQAASIWSRLNSSAGAQSDRLVEQVATTVLPV